MVGMIPPLTFAGPDEVDLHIQAEQIQWPMISPHNVDFYKRPGEPAWGHPELWNDDGTGGQILSNSLQMVMRGASGIGQSGSTKGFASSECPRLGIDCGNGGEDNEGGTGQRFLAAKGAAKRVAAQQH